jgi:CelD/BcsL family acetyltransferase involved in cellulose biosynthesis
MLGALQVRVCTLDSGINADWETLQQNGISTYFQSKAWCLSWLRDVGPEIAATAVFVTGHHSDGEPAFLLPLQVRRKYGFLLLEFLSAPHASYGFGLYDEGFLKTHAASWFEAHFDDVLTMLPRHDVVYLRELPNWMLGHGHPLLSQARMLGANRAYMMALKPDFESLLAEKRGHETLRSMRKRDKRLADMGGLTFGAPQSAIERKVAMDRMFVDHEQRLAETGVRGVYGPIERGFLTGLTDPDQHGQLALVPYVLSLDGQPICILLGGTSCNVFWAMITSLADGPWRKHSPGDFTLRHVIAAQCTKGLLWFDFAVGDSDYKLTWADQQIDMHLVLQAGSVKGFALALGLALKHGLKRFIKSNANVRQGVFALRRALLGRR